MVTLMRISIMGLGEHYYNTSALAIVLRTANMRHVIFSQNSNSSRHPPIFFMYSVTISISLSYSMSQLYFQPLPPSALATTRSMPSSHPWTWKKLPGLNLLHTAHILRTGHFHSSDIMSVWSSSTSSLLMILSFLAHATSILLLF